MKYILIIIILLFIIIPFCFAQEQELKQTTNWLKDLWQNYIYPWLKIIWNKIYSFLAKEVEQRKPEVKEEFKKETQEMKEEIPKAGESLWQRLQELIE